MTERKAGEKTVSQPDKRNVGGGLVAKRGMKARMSTWWSGLTPAQQVKVVCALITALIGSTIVALGAIIAAVISVCFIPTSVKPIAPPSSVTSFAVYPNYDPSGYMGDTGDITVSKYVASVLAGDGLMKSVDVVRFSYNVKGRGPHQHDYMYTRPDQPATFAGVMYLNPPNNFGTDPRGGYDLRGFRRIMWEARSVNGPVNVEFVAGGIDTIFDDEQKKKAPAPYPDSLPKVPIGPRSLTDEWREYTFDLPGYVTKEHLRRVVGGFGWVCSWGSNGIKEVERQDGLITPDQERTLIFELRNVRYERVK